MNTSAAPGTVVATVGWRAGPQQNSNGTVQSPNNGIYRSAAGAPGTFAKETAPGFAQQARSAASSSARRSGRSRTMTTCTRSSRTPRR